MNEKQSISPAPAITFGDILYVIFRHKWKIALISAAGLIGALALPLIIPPPYESEAKLFLKYVVEAKSPAGANDSQIKSVDERGENIINTELEILTSLDVAEQVAADIGPEKILGKAGETNAYRAALSIRKNMLLDVPKKSSVIQVIYQHGDPALVQPVLKGIIETYLKRHKEINRPAAVSDDILTKETDQIREQLVQTEESLRKAKAKAGVISLEDSQKTYSDQVAKIREAMLAAEADLAQSQSTVAELYKLASGYPTSGTNAPQTTNDVAVTPEKELEYKQICGVLENLLKKEQDLLITFTPSNAIVKQVRQQIATNQRLKKQMEDENAGLLSVRISDTKTTGEDSSVTVRAQLAMEKAKVTALQSKIKALTEQLDGLRQEISNMSEAEGTITDLQRKKVLEESHYKYFSEKLENSRIDEKLGAGRIPGISKIQEPSPPFRARTKLLKLMAMVAVAGVGSAFGLAFLIEFFLDRSIRRPAEIEFRLGLPLFMSVPLVSVNGNTRMLKSGNVPVVIPERAGGGPNPTPQHMEIVPWNPKHALRPFYATLRDRLITYFESNLIDRKPKLVAVTSCAEGAGVSTVAAGLAASLSETGDGNVLLVDMNQQGGAAQQFYKGDLGCGLDDALELEKRDSALVQDNLYVVSEMGANGQLPSILPRRFKSLIPKLKASDYDYIIFDLPRVSQISLTPRLARYMDMVLMVVESEKTDADVVKRASALLRESQAHLGVVLNKSKSYVPKSLQQEL